jgi:hypothetical protein
MIKVMRHYDFWLWVAGRGTRIFLSMCAESKEDRYIVMVPLRSQNTQHIDKTPYIDGLSMHQDSHVGPAWRAKRHQ